MVFEVLDVSLLATPLQDPRQDGNDIFFDRFVALSKLHSVDPPSACATLPRTFSPLNPQEACPAAGARVNNILYRTDRTMLTQSQRIAAQFTYGIPPWVGRIFSGWLMQLYIVMMKPGITISAVVGEGRERMSVT